MIFRSLLKYDFFQFSSDDDKTKCFSAVVGCKADLSTEREVNTDKGQELAIRLGAQYYECSAKTGENVDKVFKSLASSILSHQVNTVYKGTKQIFSLSF